MSEISNLAYIHPEAKIGENCKIGPFCFIDKNVEIGDNNVLMNNVSIHYGARIGNGNTFFPGSSISTIPQDLKFHGEDTLAIIGDNNSIRDNAIISACVLIHQFCHIGGYIMVQGGCRSSKDIPPFIVAAREPICYAGINIVGLRRRGYSKETIDLIHNAYRTIYQSGHNTTDALKIIDAEFPKTPEINYIVEFIRNSARGII